MKVCDQDCRNQKQIDQRKKDFYNAKRIHETSEKNMTRMVSGAIAAHPIWNS